MASGLGERAAEVAREREAAFIRFGSRNGSTTSQPPKERSMEEHPYTHTNPHTDPRVVAAAALIGHLGMVQQRIKDGLDQQAITTKFLQDLAAGLKKDHQFIRNLKADWERMFGVPFPESLPKEGEDVLAWLEGMFPDRKQEKAPRTAEGQPRRIRRPKADEKPATGQADVPSTVQVLKVGPGGDCEHEWNHADVTICGLCGYTHCEVFGHTGIPQNRKGRHDCHLCDMRIMTSASCLKLGAHRYSDYGWCERCNHKEPDWSLMKRAKKWEEAQRSAFDV